MTADENNLPSEPEAAHYRSIDYSNVVGGSYPPAREWAHWMPTEGKCPFAKYHDHPALEAYRSNEYDRPETDPRRSWSDPSNWFDFETVDEWVRMDPTLDDRAFIMQREGEPYRRSGDADPFLFFDGDNVRDPDTGAVIPEFVAAVELAVGGEPTYQSISGSGGGAHALGKGRLPDGVCTKYIQLRDEPVLGHDEPPMLEIYEGPKVAVLTGQRVEAAPEEIAPVDSDGLETLLEAGTDAHPNVLGAAAERRTAGERSSSDAVSEGSTRDVETGGTTGEMTIPDEAPDDLPMCYEQALRARHGESEVVAGLRMHDHGVNLYAAMLGVCAGYSIDECTAHFRAFSPHATSFDEPITRRSLEGTKAKVENGDLFPPSAETLAKMGILPGPDACDCPIHTNGPKNGSRDFPGTGPRQKYTVETCTSPVVDTLPFDCDERRAEFRGPRYDAAIDADGPVVHADPAGAGKTTNTLLGAIDRDRPAAVLFDKHEKVREELRKIGDVYPETWDPYHLKGGAQKREPRCMDADHAGEHCPEHGHPGDCPAMCPVYDLEPDAPARQRYDALRAEVGDVDAHLIMGDALPGHDEDGTCAWLEQFDELKSHSHVVGVHEYQVLKTVRKTGVGPRDVIVDEAPRSLRDTRRFDVLELTRAANTFDHLAELPGTPDGFDELARFTRDVIDAIANPYCRIAPEDLSWLDAPDIDGDTIQVDAPDDAEQADVEYETERIEVDPDDPPDDVDPDEIKTGTKREVVDPISGEYTKQEYHYVERERAVVERELVGEQLARLKLKYNETLVGRMKRNEWDGTPLCLDALLAAAVRAGLDADDARQAIAVPTTLDRCPWCGSTLAADHGARCCSSDTCKWHEEQNFVTRHDGERARADAYLDLDLERRGADSDEAPALVYESLPLASDLPDRPIVLDATATPSKVAVFYGVDPEDVTVLGGEPREANMHLTQVLDGQYHGGTIRGAMIDEDGDLLPREEWGTLADRIQKRIDTVTDLFERPLFVVKKDLIPMFDFAENAVVRHYHALRGLNHDKCDYVGCIGAPHPDMEALKREAELLATGRDDLRVGGEEYSTRRGEDGDLAANPPVYRKLRYVDENGRGRAVPTKHYTGFVGDLFREAREKELEQAVHRARPLTSETTVHIDLMTNVPTDLPVDEVCTFAELADPLKALLPVPEGALDLAELIHDVATGEADVDGFRPETLVGRVDGVAGDEAGLEFNKSAIHRFAWLYGIDRSRRTIARWVDGLVELGLIDTGEYEQRTGVQFSADPATLTRALSVVSGNAGVEVAAVRRFRRAIERADGSLDWLAWARRTLSLGGDRCEWDPPPHDPV